MKLSVVMPAYNEQDTIEAAVLDIFIILNPIEVIVVNDNSKDKTYSILRRMQRISPNLKILNNKKNKGHGYSVVKGLKKAKGDYILYIDADRQIGMQNAYTSDRSDFISGYRFHRKDKPFRLFITRVLKYTNLIRHRFYMKDANCPFKLYRRSAVQELLPMLPKTYIVPIACLEILARRHKYTTKEMPVLHFGYQGERQGFLQTINRRSIKFCWEAFKEIWKI